MIPAQSLRIGNLVYWDIPEKKDVPHTVIGVMEDRIYTTPISLGNSMDDYLPIPLTSDILIRLGFEKISDNDFRIGIPTGDGVDLSVELIDGNCVLIRYHYSDGVKTGDFDYCYFKGVKYVHELMNLYFCLTGEELTLSNNTTN